MENVMPPKKCRLFPPSPFLSQQLYHLLCWEQGRWFCHLEMNGLVWHNAVASSEVGCAGGTAMG